MPFSATVAQFDTTGAMAFGTYLGGTAVETGFGIAVVTNQSGIGRGCFTETDFETFQRHLVADFATQGVQIEATYHCPHRPDEGCDCRKPGIAPHLHLAYWPHYSFVGVIAQVVKGSTSAIALSVTIGGKCVDSRVEVC